MGLFHGIWTLLLLVAFVAVVAWVWSSKRKKHFEDAARIPFTEERSTPTSEDRKAEKNNG